MFNMLVHCTTLGATPHISNIHNSFAVEPTHPIEHVWDWTATCAQKNGLIKNLLIACHGIYTTLDNSKGLVGGFGIALGSGINRRNIHLTRKLLGKVSNIYLYVCGAAQNIPDNLEYDMGKSSVNPDYVTNNRQICFDMAAYTEAHVYASNALQNFSRSYFFNRFDFGAWEGTVEKFSPYGGVTNVTSRINSFGQETGNE
jgi:hypothetical protein